MNQNTREIKFYIQQKQNHDAVIENIKVLSNVLMLVEKVVINHENSMTILNELTKIKVTDCYDTIKVLKRLLNELESINSKEKGFLI